MFDPEFIKWFATLGIGGVLAAFMFVFYRKDVQSYTELWKSTSTVLIDVIQKNTESNVKLISLIEGLERNTIRKADIMEMISTEVNKHGVR